MLDSTFDSRFDSINEAANEFGYSGDIETEDEISREFNSRIFDSPHAGRRLQPTPYDTYDPQQSSGTDEPIVFHSEDNEFSYKKD